MSKLHIRNGRKFPPRIPQEELNERTEKKLAECGVDNVSQAKFTCEISKKVIGSKKPIYETLQPNIKCRDDEAWSRAYALVFKFLEEQKMQITLDTINTETQKTKLLLSSAFDGVNATQYLEEKITKQLQSTESFSQRVAKFVKEEGLDEQAPQKISKPVEKDAIKPPKKTIENPKRDIPESKPQNKIPLKIAPLIQNEKPDKKLPEATNNKKKSSSSSSQEKEDMFDDFSSDRFKDDDEHAANPPKKVEDKDIEDIDFNLDEDVNKDSDLDIEINLDDDEEKK
ncbi:hypothetical protein GPJ56_006750 [Histomonas meleagridis]|uniref:uncharacterized protein n=1 Tax=Histomonas meleagridis TaxID=135588 RepID=UPI0035598E2A|nr:hypothetical protein GPJ56_006750 [Histomonas meleagridis]KAH0806954.1 hypothetical protein GO595_000130 [Histomonas meleagridis]